MINSDEIYIDGKRVTVSEETIVALTYQANNIGDLQNRQGSLSNTHKIPVTAENAEILESSEQPSSDTNIPYRKLPYRLVRNGTDVKGFENASSIVENSTDAIWYNITAYGGNIDFFSAIDGKSIRDLDLSDLDHTFDLTTIVSKRSSTTEIVYPIIEWSAVDSNGSYALPTGSRTVDVRNFYFCIYVHTLINRIAQEAGFTFAGDILTDPHYLGMSIDAVDKQLGDISQLIASAKQSSPTSDNNNAGPTAVNAIMNQDIYDPLNVFEQDGSGRWYYECRVTAAYDFKIRVQYSANPVGSFSIAHYDSTGASIGILYTSSAAVQNTTIILTGISCNAGDRIRALGVASPSPGHPDTSFTFQQFEFYCTFINATQVTIGATYPVACNLPDIKQADLIKCVMQQFALFTVPETVDKKITFVRFENVRENIPQAPNWSDIIDASSIKLSYRLPNYAQQNWLRYKPDSLVPNQLGDGAIMVGDETLAKKADQLILPFAASYDTTKLQGLPVMRISRYEAGGSIIKCEPRIFQVTLDTITGPGITYTDGTSSSTQTTSIAMAYFSRAAMLYNLDFQGSLIPKYYGAWIDLIYQPKIIDALIWLKEYHIQEFSHEIPIFLSVANGLISITGNFYVNVISNYMPGHPTATQLIRL